MAQASSDPLIPKDTPFSYNTGINYESWEAGRTGYSIPKDLDQITQNFKLIKTFHDAAVGTADPTKPIIDPTQAEVIDYVVSKPGVELVMGTNNNALSILNPDGSWSPGLMASKAYTDAWVEMLIDSFGSKANVRAHLKAVLLGNEIDTAGPPPGNAKFDAYYQNWIPSAFDNLQASLSKAGLGGIAISTTIANYGVTNTVSVEIPSYIAENWGPNWNNKTPFVFFNQYTQDGQTSTNYQQVIDYFNSIQSQVGDKLEVFIGETGYSSMATPTGGPANQANVYEQIFDWLDGQRDNGGETVPLFAFDAFNRPDQSTAIEVGYGIYADNAQSQPTGLKAQLQGVIPGWTGTPIGGAHGGGSNLLQGGEDDELLAAGDGDDIVQGKGGDDTLRGQSGADLLRGGPGDDFLTGAEGDDTLDGGAGRDRLAGGSGDDALYGGVGLDRLNGGSGSDSLFGGHGHDWLDGGEGSDTMAGGDNRDSYKVDTASDLVVETAGGGIDVVYSTALAFTLPDDPDQGFVENLILEAGAIEGRGNGLDNRIDGNGGDNRLIGVGGDDRLLGWDGDDTLNGGTGDNRLEGGSGADFLNLHRDDAAFGGAGADSFYFDGNETPSGDLVIRDFDGVSLNAGNGEDKLVFAGGLESGSFSYRGDAAFSGGGNSEARFAGGGKLEIDLDGDGQADLSAKLSGLSAGDQLTATDFVWI
ncbi:MAG: hypothetical protein Kilf2KO_48100 [Rhodospirillales bacterium]